eukprot:TRINITY_DN21972_c0_g1_i1.p1 TRINITY_DN21972_c0_g1~~TRINITY_DN21972_c0_g1_i1.p1  ORF type:complete len:695 (-),score=144.41 TRINITY_DN21972_c0_g1_i1:38-2080(-)
MVAMLPALLFAAIGFQQHASAASLDCSADTFGDPVRERCCKATSAWAEIEARGGCGGPGTTTEQCSAAESLCHQCRGALSAYATSTGRSPSSAVEGASLSTVGYQDLEMRCVLPTYRQPCHGAIDALGFGALMATGMVLLLLVTGGLVLFDFVVLPMLVVSYRRRLAEEDPPTPPPLPSKLPPPAPPGAPREPSVEALDCLRAAAATAHCESSSFASACDVAELGCIRRPGSPTCKVPESPEKPSFGGMPRRMASVWALRRVFVLVSSTSALTRVAYILSCVMLLSGPRHQAHPAQYVTELVLSVLPWLWCVCMSRPGSSGSSARVPTSAAYWGPCQRLPRFTTFAVLTICTELFSTGASAMMVARAPCDAPPWRGVLLYCLGVLVAVARAYSAVLALRLQDQLAAACRKVLPVKQEYLDAATEAAAAAASFPAPVEVVDVQCSLDLGEGVGEGLDEQSSLPPEVQAPWQTTAEKEPLKEQSSCSWPLCHRLWQPSALVLEPVKDMTACEEEKLACAMLPAGCCPALRRRLAGKRLLVRAGIGLLVLSAVASAFVVRELVGGSEDEDKEEFQSSCPVAQNHTTTCIDWELAGTYKFDSKTGELAMDRADTLEACCAGCDQESDCQAWIFERLAKRCRWIRFKDPVCVENPADLRCRCRAHVATAFGFKSKSKLVWLQRSK